MCGRRTDFGRRLRPRHALRGSPPSRHRGRGHYDLARTGRFLPPSRPRRSPAELSRDPGVVERHLRRGGGQRLDGTFRPTRRGRAKPDRRTLSPVLSHHAPTARSRLAGQATSQYDDPFSTAARSGRLGQEPAQFSVEVGPLSLRPVGAELWRFLSCPGATGAMRARGVRTHPRSRRHPRLRSDLGAVAASRPRVVARRRRGANFLPRLPTMLEHPLQAATMVLCILVCESWNWQFRGPNPPTRLLRQTWVYQD